MIIYHSADNDGKLSGAIASAALPHEKVVGWDFGDYQIDVFDENYILVVDLPLSCIQGIDRDNGQIPDSLIDKICWVDHHASSIANSAWSGVAGVRIDGVAACRLAWQYFFGGAYTKQDFVDRKVSEPHVVNLVGEYDVWDKRNPDAESFQFGSYDWGFEEFREIIGTLKEPRKLNVPEVPEAINLGRKIQKYQSYFAGSVLEKYGYYVDFEGIKFLMLNSTHARSSLWFPEEVIANCFPEAQALCAIRMNGTHTTHVSLYHRKGHEHLDLSVIAVKNGGGGHKGACGFTILTEDCWYCVEK